MEPHNNNNGAETQTQRKHRERLELIQSSPFMISKLETPEQHQILVTASKLIAEFLEFHSVLSFARINKAVFGSLAQHISNRFWVVFAAMDYWPFKKYSPSKIKIKTHANPKLPDCVAQVVYGHLLNALPPYFSPRLTHLTFGKIFNQALKGLPPTLTHLTLGASFNQTLDDLPQSLTHLTVGVSFNQPLEHLPSSLTYLFIGKTFSDQQILVTCVYSFPLNSLPPAITHLYLDTQLSHSINSFPPNLTHLSIQNIDKTAFVNCTLPASLTHLFITRQAIQQLQHPIPVSVKLQRYF